MLTYLITTSRVYMKKAASPENEVIR
jgi:hypothetical protein